MVTKEQVKHLSWLARIDLSDEELLKYTAQIEQIISYLDKLDSMPLENAPAVKEKKNLADLRSDEPASFDGDVVGTKYRKDGFVKAPRML
ncbi:MAG: Asp-tRNA(Asn)/Glu-tRNA(Gln) amidotransferase GatCAB subunit C [Nitrososphaera sp.]|nr:Asp-tRNA(Asn)/Glu-tRNA(Gln) amidotransferase GatCAB subunit C [Nitrososphaera sp.]